MRGGQPNRLCVVESGCLVIQGGRNQISLLGRCRGDARHDKDEIVECRRNGKEDARWQTKTSWWFLPLSARQAKPLPCESNAVGTRQALQRTIFPPSLFSSSPSRLFPRLHLSDLLIGLPDTHGRTVVVRRDSQPGPWHLGADRRNNCPTRFYASGSIIRA